MTVMPHERHGVWNHMQLDCLFNNLFRLTKKESFTLLTLYEGNPLTTISNTESVLMLLLFIVLTRKIFFTATIQVSLSVERNTVFTLEWTPRSLAQFMINNFITQADKVIRLLNCSLKRPVWVQTYLKHISYLMSLGLEMWCVNTEPVTPCGVGGPGMIGCGSGSVLLCAEWLMEPMLI